MIGKHTNTSKGSYIENSTNRLQRLTENRPSKERTRALGFGQSFERRSACFGLILVVIMTSCPIILGQATQPPGRRQNGRQVLSRPNERYQAINETRPTPELSSRGKRAKVAKSNGSDEGSGYKFGEAGLGQEQGGKFVVEPELLVDLFDDDDEDDEDDYDYEDFYLPTLPKTGGTSSAIEKHKEQRARNFYGPSNGTVGPKLSASSRVIGRQEASKKVRAASVRDYQVGESFVGRPRVCAMALARGGCITYHMVEWAIRNAKRALKFRQPRGLNSLDLSEATINSIGELNELTTRILARRFRLSWEEISFEMEQINIGRTSLWGSCPSFYRSPPRCPLLSRYRSHSGQCNNLLAPNLGSSNMPFVRILPPDYGDAVGAPRLSASTGNQLPPARLLALALHPDIENFSPDQSAMYMSWGQLINHDIALASGARAATGHEEPCCPRSRRGAAGGRVCMPIEIGPDDPLYAQYGIRCHDFKRSLAALRPGCTLGPRTQLNIITSYIDASFVYGSTRSASSSLRANSDGLMRVWNYFQEEGLKPLLPPQVENPDEECVGRPRGRFCFKSGDSRTNQQIQLVTLHTIHLRQHNRLALSLAALNPHWSDNRLYHEARHIHIAMVQHILLAEYLPILLGPKLCAKYELLESQSGAYWDHYDPSINPGVSQAFAAAAFRQGHTTVPSQVFRFNNQHEPLRVYQLRQLFRQPWALFEAGAVDELLLGLLDVPAQSFDPFMSSDLSGHLLEVPGQPVGLDLSAINIQRGRDQGVAGYNAYREWCALGRLESFSELSSYMSNRSAQNIATLYESVDDIDLFSAGISEFPLEGAQVGPTFACIIGRQMQNLRAADRFWFESSLGPHAFTPSQLESIKQVSLARLICANSDSIISIQQLALQLAHPILNPRLHCDELPDVDISLWFEPQTAPGAG